MAKLEFPIDVYLSAKVELSRSAAPIISEQQAAGYGFATDIQNEIYIPMSDLSVINQVIGIVVAFMEDIQQILFKNGVWKNPNIIQMFNIGVTAFKMIKSILMLFKK